MAESANLLMFSEQELTCSICLDLFSDPVSTPCGHNFCQRCIGSYWATSAACSCPLCKRQFNERPELSVNKVFAMIADKYKESRYGAVAPDPEKAGDGVAAAAGIACDVCTGRKQPAVKSCLTCTASYCEAHVQPHLETPCYSHHQLMEPHEALRGRTCSTHNRLLEVYCRTDERCICAICVLEEHRTHRTVSVQTERANKQKLLGKTELEIQSRIKEKTVRLTELKSKVDSLRNFAQGEVSEVEQILVDMSQAVERIRGELVGGIQEKQATMEARGHGLISRLEGELGQLQTQRANLEMQASSEDHIGFLKSFEAANNLLPMDPEEPEPDGLELHLPLGEVKRALAELRDRLEEIHMGEIRSQRSVSLPESESMMSLQGMRRREWSLRDLRRIRSGSGIKKLRAYADDINLNPVTAYPFLILSDDRKQVKRGEKLQFYRNSAQRYDVWSCVLAKEGFSSGRHYWELQVGENKDWKVGVVRESAQRKGLFDMSPANGYFGLWWGGSQLRALTAPPLVKIKISSRLRRVGVFLDCEEGLVAFYNAKTGSEVYSFSMDEFAEKMMPFLGTGDKEVPLVLLSAQYSIPE
ncbi:E3 ubiquitin-protein ligase TRIM21 [Megalops cyprinoides]|uniref:E3 ubiquitin-protein ligase TRIM21 n=1 Tax=Megalops cyprinoides TaxID=118141 RepID=UPI0018641520|nr:E3 ubiquitin-protein ligase TRIM21 [Megalops cyprinoides]